MRLFFIVLFSFFPLFSPRYAVSNTDSINTHLIQNITEIRNELNNEHPAKKISGKQLLHLCTIGAEKEVVQAISEGADLSIAADNGFTCLDIASQYGHEKLVSILLHHKNKIPQYSLASSFIIAVLTENMDVVTAFLDNHIDPNIKSRIGITPLTVAVDENNIKLTELLLKTGAEPDISEDDGLTPLMISKSREMTACLLSTGADPNRKNKNGQTALMLAPSLEIMRLLLTSGADVHLRDHFGRNVLMYSVEKNNLEAVTLLLENDADATAKDNSGMTALMRLGDYKLVEYILQYPQDINTCNNSGSTALGVAAYSGRLDLMPLLLKYGADVNASGSSEYTPIALALKSLHNCANILDKNMFVDIINFLLRNNAKLSKEDNLAIQELSPKLRNAINLLH